MEKSGPRVVSTETLSADAKNCVEGEGRSIIPPLPDVRDSGPHGVAEIFLEKFLERVTAPLRKGIQAAR